eukprot:jgi/Botrbrau1/20898/Bobra.0135s0029.1
MFLTEENDFRKGAFHLNSSSSLKQKNQLQIMSSFLRGGKTSVPFGSCEFSKTEFEKLLFKVVQYATPADSGAEKVNILLMGGVGGGKSSFISSLDSIFEGRISRRAPAGQAAAEGPLTRCLKKYHYTVKGKTIGFTLWDTPGWTPSDYRDGVLNGILNGSIRDRTDPRGPTKNHVPPHALKDEVHVLAFVVPCDAVSDDDYIAKLVEIKEYARIRDMPVMVFLTKIDEHEPGLLVDLAATFNSQRIYDIVQDLAFKAGLPRNSIVPIKNFSMEFEPGLNASILVLRGIYEVLNSATDYLREEKEEVEPLGEFKKLKVRARKDFEADDPDEYLSLQKGKVYWQISPPEDGWVLGCLVEDPNNEGLFPKVQA